MANIKSQQKRNERTRREQAENRRYTVAIKTHMRHLQEAAEAGDQPRVEEQFVLVHRNIDKAVKIGAIHRNNGARKKARAARFRASVSS